MQDQTTEGAPAPTQQQPRPQLPYIQLVLVAAKMSQLSAEYEDVKSLDEVPNLMKDLIERNDMRVATFPMPFPNALNPALVTLHAGGLLYDAGFSREETISMIVDAATGRVVTCEVPQAIVELAPHLAAAPAETSTET